MIKILCILVALLFSIPSLDAFAMEEERWMDKEGWSLLYVDSEELADRAGGAGHFAFDNDITTSWVTEWKDRAATPGHPHEIQIDLGRNILIGAFSCLHRQEETTRNGTVREYELYITEDLKNWGKPVLVGSFRGYRSEDVVYLKTPVQGRYFKFVALSEIKGKPWTAIAELGVLEVTNNLLDLPYCGLNVVINPVNDSKVTGYKLFILNTKTNKEKVYDLGNNVTKTLNKSELDPDVELRFTAIAYGMVNGQYKESIRSKALYIKLNTQDNSDPSSILEPTVPKLIELF